MIEWLTAATGWAALVSAAILSAVVATVALVLALLFCAVVIVAYGYVHGDWFEGALAGIIGLAVYFFICCLLKTEESQQFLNMVRRRLSFKKVEAPDQGEARGI